VVGKAVAPAADEPQSSRRALTSRLLRPADASVRSASDSALAARLYEEGPRVN
jgi:hypothetical protein